MLLIWTNLDKVMDMACPSDVRSEMYQEQDYTMKNQDMIHTDRMQLNVVSKRKKRGKKRRSPISPDQSLTTFGNTATSQGKNGNYLNYA